MLKWICTECYSQYRGWAMYHRFRSGHALCCPGCNARLEFASEAKEVSIIKELIGGSV